MWHRGVTLVRILATLAVGPTLVSAAALRPGKVTDVSVCDLGPETTSYLGSKTLIPASAPAKDQVAAYFRLGAEFVAKNCTDGQLLVLHGQNRLPLDSAVLSELAGSSCLISDVARTEGQGTDGRATYATFELRCTIRKLNALRAKLAELEVQDPLSVLLGRVARSGNGPGADASSLPPPPPTGECDRASLSSLIQGGRCR